MEDYHKPEHVKLVEEMLAELNGEDLAAKSNALIGGSMLADHALKMVRMVALAALRAPGKKVVVAGFGALVTGDKLEFFMFSEEASRTIKQDPILKDGTEGL